MNGLVAGDTVTISATGAFDTKNVGTGKTVTLSSSEGGADAGNYSFTRQASTTASITPKALIVSGATADDKVYDGNTAATVNAGTVDGVVAGDSVNLAGTFDTKNVGTGKTVTLSSAGTDGGNYTVTSQTTAQADITPKAVTVSGITADDKVYDGTTAATVDSGGAVVNGLVAGDDVTLSATGAFDTKNVGTGKTVTLSSTQGGADAGNYSFTNQGSTTASISRRALTITGTVTANDKVYDGNTVAAVDTSGAAFTGLVAGDDYTIAGSFADKNVGTGKAVALSGGGVDAGNYNIVNQTGTSTTADITPKAVTVSGITAGDKVYDGTTAATVNTGSAMLDGLVAGDDVTLSATGAFDNKNVGAGKNVALTSTQGGVDAGNYSFTNQASTTASITPKALIVSGATADDKVYDGNTAATVNAGTVDGVVAGDSVSLAGTFDTKNVGTGKTVTLSSGGTDGGNYTLTSQTTTQADITPKAVTVSGITADDKVYDGTAAATVNTGSAVLDGVVAGDAVTLSATGTFDTKNVGTGKTVTLSSIEGGADAGNYTFNNQASTTASITPKALTITANDDVQTAGAPYSGGNGVVYAGFVAGEDAGVLQGQLAYGGTSQGAQAPGNYSITPGGFVDGNYAIRNVDGTLTLAAAPTPTPSAPELAKPDNALIGNAGGSAVARANPAHDFGDVAIEVVVRPTEEVTGFAIVWVPHNTASQGRGFSVALPQGFANAAAADADVQITQLDGRPLPGWLHYDSQGRTLEAGAVPHGALPWQQVATVNGKRMVIAITERPQLSRR